MTHYKENIDQYDLREKAIVEKMGMVLPEKKGRTISTLSVRPNVKFDAQNEHEEVFILIRRHIVTNSYWVIRSMLLAIIPFVVITVVTMGNAGESILDIFGYGNLLIVIFGWYLIVIILSLSGFLGWFYNVLIITNERIIDIDYVPALARRISETALESVQDVTEIISNFMASIFHYGNIRIQTAAERAEFEFNAAPRPEWLRDKILDLASVRKQMLEQ